VRRSSKKPLSYAAARLWWLAAASLSWDSRLTCHCAVVTAWCSPIDRPVRGSAVRDDSGIGAKGASRLAAAALGKRQDGRQVVRRSAWLQG
jgi:hypothetical protein